MSTDATQLEPNQLDDGFGPARAYLALRAAMVNAESSEPFDGREDEIVAICLAVGKTVDDLNAEVQQIWEDEMEALHQDAKASFRLQAQRIRAEYLFGRTS